MSDRSSTSGALDGLVIADFGRVLAGPYATMLLADLGAEVIKVERPGCGDDTRAWGPPWGEDGQSTYFQSVNRNKRSVELDLRDPEQHAAARRLAARADVLVENFLPGTMARLGMGYEDLRPTNPGLVYCSISGFGQQSSLPGYDLLAQAAGGLMGITGSDSRHPVKAGVAVVDVITGLHATVGILAALRHRARSGIGQRVEVNLLSSLLSALVNQASGYIAGGVVPRAMGNRHPSISPYEVFEASDRSIVIAVGNNKQFHALASALDAAEAADDERFGTNQARVENREALIDLLTPRLRAKPAHEWFAVLTSLGVPCAPVNDLPGAFDLAKAVGLDPIYEFRHAYGRPAPQVAHPIRFSVTPPRYRSAPPLLGATSIGELDAESGTVGISPVMPWLPGEYRRAMLASHGPQRSDT
jgi:crotonobetainyl-CoA:carnitine CoA-transferase CaiB-like acyl-CoA transferase